MVSKKYQSTTVGVQRALQLILDGMGSMESFITGPEGPQNPNGLLSTFTAFTTTQLLPILKMRYDIIAYNNAIFGSTSEANLSKYVHESQNAINNAMVFYDKVATACQQSRLSKIRNITSHWKDLDIWVRTQEFTFNDEVTGQVFMATKSSTIEDMRRFVINNTLGATQINLYMGTASHRTWPLMQAGGSNLVLKSRVAVQKGMCWSNSMDCTKGRHEGMPEGHNYEDYNISNIDIKDGSEVDFIEVTYKNRINGQTLTQKIGNPNWGGTPSTGNPQNLLSNPIVKAKWMSSKISFGYGFLDSFEFTQADGNGFVKAGNDKSLRTITYTDDFSFWSGSVWLCGMDLHGNGNRVHGIGPHWCYNELYTEVADPAPPPSDP